MSGHDHSRGPIDLIYHRGRLLAVWAASMTIGWWAEHILWGKIPPFCTLAHWAGVG